MSNANESQSENVVSSASSVEAKNKMSIKKVYIVAGGHAVGKSSVICQICGTKTENEDMEPAVMQLHTKKYGTLSFFCDSKSLQESSIQPDDVEEHIKKKGGENCQAILISLRTDRIPKLTKLPEADRYISKFKELHWEIEGVIEFYGNNDSFVNSCVVNFGKDLSKSPDDNTPLYDSTAYYQIIANENFVLGWADAILNDQVEANLNQENPAYIRLGTSASYDEYIAMRKSKINPDYAD